MFVPEGDKKLLIGINCDWHNQLLFLKAVCGCLTTEEENGANKQKGMIIIILIKEISVDYYFKKTEWRTKNDKGDRETKEEGNERGTAWCIL